MTEVKIEFLDLWHYDGVGINRWYQFLPTFEKLFEGVELSENNGGHPIMIKIKRWKITFLKFNVVIIEFRKITDLTQVKEKV